MIAALSRGRRQGIRQVNLNNDLGAIAQVIETAFGATMDTGGRRTIAEMRTLSRMGPLLKIMALADDMLKGIGQGFVWEEDGHIVGNVTLFPASFPVEFGKVIVIANVAVLPDYRRRGIARQLVSASLEALQSWGSRTAILQVEADNDAARHLYETMGFRVQRRWHQWRRSSYNRPPQPLSGSPRITLRAGREWHNEFALASRIFPAEMGGLGWMRPLHVREFHRSAARHTLDFLSGTTIERWIVREGQQLAASLWAKTSFGSSVTRLTMLVPEDRRNALADPLLNYGLRRLSDSSHRSLYCEHPADDEIATRVLNHYGFVPRRTLDHMRLDL